MTAASPVSLRINDRVATISIDRPQARNAMTFEMYEALGQALSDVRETNTVRALVLTGNAKAFMAGTDISEFTSFQTAAQGVDYEAQVEAIVSAVEAVPVPTIAVMRGVAAGGGLVIASVCDLRLMSATARVGVPIARTVGNCLSSRNLQRLERAFGPGPVRQMLIASELLTAARCREAGFATWLVDDAMVEEHLTEKLAVIVDSAPRTLGATKAALSRLSHGDLTDSDIIEKVYGSADFREGTAAFVGKRPPRWSGD